MSRNKLIGLVADKIMAVIVGLLSLVSFALLPLFVSLHFYPHNDILSVFVSIFLEVTVSLLWLGFGRWRKWPKEKYTKATKTDTKLKPPAV